jgi:hypothetical protein
MKRVFGSILMAVGILIAGASGLCSLVVIQGTANEFGGEFVVQILAMGGIPFGIGLALFFGGRALVRRARADATKKPAPKTQVVREPEPTAPSSQ